MTGDNSTRRQWRTAVADWRNWRLPVKLAAVLAVPVLVALGSGLTQIGTDVRAADGYANMQRLVSLRAGLTPLVASVQDERALSAQRAEGAGVDKRNFDAVTNETDRAANAVRDLVRNTPTLGPVAEARYRDALVQLDGLPQLRDRVSSGGVDLAGGIGAYSVVIRSLTDFDQAMVGDFGDASLTGTANALHNLAMTGEQVSWQQATVLAGVSRRGLLDTEKTMLEQSWTRFQDKVAEFTAVATADQQADFRSTVAGPEVDTRNRLLQGVRTDPGTVRTQVPVKDWNTASSSTLSRIEVVMSRLGGELLRASARLQDSTSDRAGVASVILLASLFSAGAIGFVVGSYLLRSLRTLRVAALDVANNRLPELVTQLREGGVRTGIEPVPVHTTEEFGQLARAFDAVHSQAVSSAAEQAELRAGMRNAFINLSRRSQGLVERQLKLMEEMERQEENPDQLANLFKLDNLATRMRRNNENLMVLSGSDVARRFTRPVPLADVLRAAGSEIEQYHRVMVQTTPPVDVVGYAAGDLVRLVAELLDNATAFSPPGTQVVVSGRPRPGGGVLVDVVDQGVGLTEEGMAEANRKIVTAARDDSAELSASRQLGLYVVGRLAGRHGIQVVLREQGAERDGVRAVVAVPSELVRPAGTGQLPAARRPAAELERGQGGAQQSALQSNVVHNALQGGSGQNGAVQRSAPQNGTPQNGTAPFGAAQNGAAHNGTAQNGTALGGATQNGATQNGASSGGAPVSESGWAAFAGRALDQTPPAKPEPGRSEPGRSEQGRLETARSEPGRSETTRSEQGGPRAEQFVMDDSFSFSVDPSAPTAAPRGDAPRAADAPAVPPRQVETPPGGELPKRTATPPSRSATDPFRQPEATQGGSTWFSKRPKAQTAEPAAHAAPAAPPVTPPTAPPTEGGYAPGRATAQFFGAPSPARQTQPPAIPAEEVPSRHVTAAGAELPKRKPRTNLDANLVTERPARAEGESAAPPPVRRDPSATRGFLANYQTGVRQGVREAGDNRTGRETEQ
ncbi:nitrate- and nitrite sensing domain-containing protein [Actinosynnema pretiosum subsp. pretiosum]|uniref:histidine kinase n=1 Tax=Actinosynnema pretiosum subsp. pretiosum TaxID=103721 RepID=A0AA45L5F7_9PSEU|nr:nitrate- and nitrite sensing domain-containing protein [Actinosynnema pretiosum subsp. pretiosum]